MLRIDSIHFNISKPSPTSLETYYSFEITMTCKILRDKIDSKM